MLTQERYDLILRLLAEKRAVTVTELTQALNTSESTIRRDLAALDAQGLLTKVHGGATALGGLTFTAAEEDMVTKAGQNVPEKEAIGQYAATLVEDDDFVYIDAGTSTAALVAALGSSRATFVTNGIDHARALSRKGLKAYILGGRFKPSTEAITGAAAVAGLRQYNFTKCFLGTNGITPEAGYTTPDAEEAALKSEAMSRAYLTYILADHSKFGKVSSITFAPLEKACVITDRAPAEGYAELTILKEVPHL